jgi:predicted Rdx family selenoprotein
VEAEVKALYPDSNINLIEGGGGIFDVKFNGKLIYSKQKSEDQRFPIEGEITRLIKQEMG